MAMFEGTPCLEQKSGQRINHKLIRIADAIQKLGWRMRHRTWILACFPAYFILLLLAERVATFALGYHPSSAWLWQVSLELRGLFGGLVNINSHLTGHSILAQMVLLIGCAAAIVLLARRESFRMWLLLNHAVLLVAGAAMAISMPQTVASAAEGGIAGGTLAIMASPNLALKQGALFLLGLAACGYSHHAYISGTKRRHAQIKLNLFELRIDR